MVCVSINYKKADEIIRGKFAFDKDKRRELSGRLMSFGGECVILCTCSRTEVYACGGISAENIMEALAGAAGVGDIKQYAMIFCGNSAVNHLFRVACGIDSMVMGEDEILGQTREAYKEACDDHRALHELNMVFQAALACAKRIKTDTSLSGVPVSTATLAANEAAAHGEDILLIGASGKIGLSTMKNLLAHRNVRVTVTARKHIPDVGDRYGDRIKVVPYEDRYSYMDKADCIISATSCPVYTLTYERLRESIITSKPRLFIDLAVPHDIDERVIRIEKALLMGIDHFEGLAKSNNMIKLSAKEKAEAIIADEIDALRKNISVQRYLEAAEDIGASIHQKGFDRLIYRLKVELDADGFDAVINVMTDFGKE